MSLHTLKQLEELRDNLCNSGYIDEWDDRVVVQEFVENRLDEIIADLKQHLKASGYYTTEQ